MLYFNEVLFFWRFVFNWAEGKTPSYLYSHLILVTAFYTRGQMALPSHTFPLIIPTDSTWWLSYQGTLDAGGNFRVQLRRPVNQAAGFNSPGENVDLEPWEQESTVVVRGGYLKQWTGGNKGLRPFPKAEQHFQQQKHHQTGLQLMQPKFQAGWTVPSQCCIKSGPSQVSPLHGCCKIERCTQFEDSVEILRMRRILLILKFVKRHLKMNLMRKCCSNYGCFYKC